MSEKIYAISIRCLCFSFWGWNWWRDQQIIWCSWTFFRKLFYQVVRS